MVAIEKSGDDFLVETNGAGSFRAPVVQVSAGAWGGALSARFGEPVPIVAKGPQMGVTEPLPYRIGPVVGVASTDEREGMYLRQVKRGNIVFGGGWRGPALPDILRAYMTLRTRCASCRCCAAWCRRWARCAPIRTWSGIEGYLPDDLPIMGPSGKVSGLSTHSASAAMASSWAPAWAT